MAELGKITDIVEGILLREPTARGDDDYLYIKVLEYYGRVKGVDFSRVAVNSFFKQYRAAGIPSPESVGRCRRKLQEQYEELRPDKEKQEQRANEENKYKAYAVNH